MPMHNVASFSDLDLATVFTAIYAPNYTATKQTKNARQTVCQLLKGQFVGFKVRVLNCRVRYKDGATKENVYQKDIDPFQSTANGNNSSNNSFKPLNLGEIGIIGLNVQGRVESEFRFNLVTAIILDRRTEENIVLANDDDIEHATPTSVKLIPIIFDAFNVPSLTTRHFKIDITTGYPSQKV